MGASRPRKPLHLSQSREGRDEGRGESDDKISGTLSSFAPSVLAEETNRYFDLPHAEENLPAQFMLYAAPVHENMRSVIPAVTHVDGTSRLQTMHSSESPWYNQFQPSDRHRGYPSFSTLPST